MKTVIVAGALANKPNNGGEALVRLNWIRAFQLSGFRVAFVEQIGTPTPEAVGYFERVTRSFDLDATLFGDDGRVISGNADPRAADLLVNISGHLKFADVVKRVRRTAYIDIDPGYTQIWHEQALALIAPHDHYFTIGENIGTPECPIPTGGIPWKRTRQPATFIDTPDAPPRHDRFTSVAAWRGSFGSVEYNGRTYGQKAHQFRKFIELPTRTAHAFEIALQIYPGDAKDQAALESNGWRLVEPQSVAGAPAAYQNYVRDSSAEFSVAQGIYVETNSGWFSDRTVQYLSAGRPALVQDTGFARDISPAGVGVVSFRTIDEAVAGADAIVRDYETHSRAVREIARTAFDYKRIVDQICEEVGLE